MCCAYVFFHYFLYCLLNLNKTKLFLPSVSLVLNVHFIVFIAVFVLMQARLFVLRFYYVYLFLLVRVSQNGRFKPLGSMQHLMGSMVLGGLQGIYGNY